MDLNETNFTNQTSFLDCPKDVVLSIGQDIASIFYLMNPYDHLYKNVHDVPNYEIRLFYGIALLFVFEQFYRLFRNRRIIRIQDLVVNTGSSLIFTFTRIFLWSYLIILMDYFYKNYRILDLPLDSIWTWIVSLLLIEFIYYWTHRALHEINFLWAAHSFHHMAEDINILTTVRDSVVDLVIYDLFPLPLSFIVSPTCLLVHMQFSLIYQVWLHTEEVGHLGFLEYIINTPRQHRVHHGKNKYCIDKNYGALLMIWDRIFGTYQSEKDDEKIKFGIVSEQPKTFDSLYLQFGPYTKVWNKFFEVKGFNNKMKSIFYGPGWVPGKGRLGDLNDIPAVDPNDPKFEYDPYVPSWQSVYIFINIILVFSMFAYYAALPDYEPNTFNGILGMVLIIYTLQTFGAIFDHKPYAAAMEITRIIAFILYAVYCLNFDYKNEYGKIFLTYHLTVVWIGYAFLIGSLLIWFYILIKNTSFNTSTSQKKPKSELDGGHQISSSIIMSYILSLLIITIINIFIYANKFETCKNIFRKY